mgnify:CR=1 FL=1
MIHYHGATGVDAKFLSTVFLNRHAFISYAHPGNLQYVSKICSTFSLDNGAYTAWKKQEKYDFNGFVEFVKEWERHPAYHFHLIPDVIDGSEKENQKMIENWKLQDGVPVWHMHESLEFLKDLVSSFKLISIGSSGQYSTVNNRKWWKRMDEIMNVICENGIPKCKIHGLRMLNIEVFTKIPFHSADSTYVVRSSKYDKLWKGPKTPKNTYMRGLLLADKIESFQSTDTYMFSKMINKKGLNLI